VLSSARWSGCGRGSPDAHIDLFKEQAPFFFRRLPISADVVPADMQADLVRLMKEMPLKPFGFHGYEGKRRVVSFGGKVDFDTQLFHGIQALYRPRRSRLSDRLLAGYARQGFVCSFVASLAKKPRGQRRLSQKMEGSMRFHRLKQRIIYR
jgi:hypothetical protein